MTWLNQKHFDPISLVFEQCESARKNGREIYNFFSRKPVTGVNFILDDEKATQNFAREFIHLHIRSNLSSNLSYDMSYAAINTLYGYFALACNRGSKSFQIGHNLRHLPVILADYLGMWHYELTEKNKDFDVREIRENGLLIIRSPHLQSGWFASKEKWQEICQRCSQINTRILCDATYSKLFDESVALSEMAVDFPKLSWAEVFSTECILGGAWYLNAIVGTKDFISDYVKVRKTHGVLHVFEVLPITAIKFFSDEDSIKEIINKYRKRVEILSEIFVKNKFIVFGTTPAHLSIETPQTAFGEKIRDSEHFNLLMIGHIGIAGLPYKGTIGYSVFNVCLEDKMLRKTISDLLNQTQISYNPQ